jgi:hypothetical protein
LTQRSSQLRTIVAEKPINKFSSQDISKSLFHSLVCLFVAHSRKILPGPGNVCISYQLLAQIQKLHQHLDSHS